MFPRPVIISGTISRSDFCAAVEAGIAAAERSPLRSTSLPRTWRARLRKVARTAASVTANSFENCPLTQAGLYSPGCASVLWDFAGGFDAAAKRAAGLEPAGHGKPTWYRLTVKG